MSDTRKKAYEKLNSFLKQSLWPLAYRDYLKSLDALYASEFSDQAFQSITEQTLADVQAGIPARDAEIEALRKQVETLQAQLVDRSPEMQGTLVDESPKLQSQKQPVSGADQFRDAAQMIEPSGKIDEDAEFMGWLNATCTYDDLNKPEIELAKNAWQARAALAQQDANTGETVSVENQRVTQREADKVDAERYRFIRDGEQDVWCSVGDWPLSGDELDAAIDAVRKEQE